MEAVADDKAVPEPSTVLSLLTLGTSGSGFNPETQTKILSIRRKLNHKSRLNCLPK
ncbi:MAG UNVERIFIED_CONTAM: PEP-CTERM sorting domain-containing protein [Microcystis novacekii LVE1205-3]